VWEGDGVTAASCSQDTARIAIGPEGALAPASAARNIVQREALMFLHFGRAFLVLGWALTIAGVIHLLVGLRHMTSVRGASPAFLLIGLTAAVVGSALVRWARRAR
jgi:hypothetical protein